MDPGTWNAPGKNNAVALAGGVACCRRPKSPLARFNDVEPPDVRPVCTVGRGE